MRDDRPLAFETFLVQDVILTLGNLRGSLVWLADGGPATDPAIFRAGLDRVERQIGRLEDRARALCRAAAPPPPAAWGEARAAYAGGSGLTLEHLLRDALGEEAAQVPPVFRSQRAGLG
ncbi:MAG: hypothetical protein IT542_01470 [Rubellimicrobium sp.]|nr:hypothetical protein [Rubellimicrobium sp.]